MKDVIRGGERSSLSEAVMKQFSPIRFIDGIGGNDTPDLYDWNNYGLLGAHQATLFWHLVDFSGVHQTLYGEFNKKFEMNEKFYDDHLSNESSFQPLSNEESEEDFEERAGRELYQSRLRDRYLRTNIEISRAKNFSDEFTVIGLWATAERYLNKVLNGMESHTGGGVSNNSYKWYEFKAAFEGKSIVLEDLHGFVDADECRVLNNTIKHSEEVTQRLASYSFFAPLVGKRLVEVEFELQRYLTGVTHFLGALIEAANKFLDPAFAQFIPSQPPAN